MKAPKIARRSGRTLGLILLGILALPIAAFGQQEAPDLFQQALRMERVSGDLEEAIRLYQQVVETGNRPLGARALIRIAESYEKLGRRGAQAAYSRVIQDFGDQTEQVALARERLDEIEQTAAELSRQPTFRKIEIASKPENGVLSPDGNRMAFISEGAVWIVPLHGRVDPSVAGEPVRLADVPGVWDVGSLLSWSADGAWIGVNGGANDEEGVYVIPAAGGEPRVVQILERQGTAFSYRLSLSPDGGKVAIAAVEPDTRQEAPWARSTIFSIRTSGGETQQLADIPGNHPAFSPDGRFVAFVGSRERKDWPENAERGPVDGDLWVVPSTGGTPVKVANVDGRLRGPIWSLDGRFIAAHYEREFNADSKEIWVYPLAPGASGAGEPIRIPLPRSSWQMLAGWTPAGELGFFMESKSHEAIYTVSASGGKAVQVTPEGQWLYYPRWSPNGDRIYFRSHPRETPSPIAYVPSNGGSSVEIPFQPERGMYSRVPGGGNNVSPDGSRIVISAVQRSGYSENRVDLWTVPVDGGRPTRLTSDPSFEGYPCWSPDGRWIAFTDSHEKSEDEGFRAIYMVPAGGGEIRQITSEADSVGGGAIAFTPDGRRIAFFSNGMVKTIPMEGGRSEILVAEADSDGDSDLAFSPAGSEIAYNVGGKIWITSLAGGESKELRTGLQENARLGNFGWSPDGEKIAFMVSIGGEPEFWLISDFLPGGR